MYTPIRVRDFDSNSNKKQTAVLVKLITGRKHQIRAQFSALGCPIVGDVRYGASQRFKERDIALHAFAVGFDHPVNRTSRIKTVSSIRDNDSWIARFGVDFVDKVHFSVLSHIG